MHILGSPSIDWRGVSAPTLPRKKALSVQSEQGLGGSENFKFFSGPYLLNQGELKSKDGFYEIPGHMPRHSKCSFARGMPTKWFPTGAEMA